jgi:excisionase family DNA binding protein
MTQEQKPYNELPDVLTVDEAAAYLRVGRSSIYEAVRQREVTAIRIGRRIVIPKRGIERLLDGDKPP